MRRTLVTKAAGVLLLVPALAGQSWKSKTAAASVARGKYLVENVGMCGDCHTPRNEKGEPVKEQWLAGALLSFKPTVPIPVWAENRLGSPVCPDGRRTPPSGS